MMMANIANFFSNMAKCSSRRFKAVAFNILYFFCSLVVVLLATTRFVERRLLAILDVVLNFSAAEYHDLSGTNLLDYAAIAPLSWTDVFERILLIHPDLIRKMSSYGWLPVHVAAMDVISCIWQSKIKATLLM